MADDLIIIGILLFAIIATMYFLLKKDDTNEGDDYEDIYSLNYLMQGVKDKMNELTNTGVSNLNLSKDAAKKEELRKLQLIKALRTCNYGDLNAKLYVKDYIKKILLHDFEISEMSINRIIPFDDVTRLTVCNKFDIILHHYKKKYQYEAFSTLILENEYHQLKGEGTRENVFHYEITKQDIENLYDKLNIHLDYLDKLEIIIQRIYSLNWGNGVIDEIRDMKKLDGISAGLSGLPNENYDYLEEYMIENREEIGYYFDSVWIMFQGKTIHLSFMGFGCQSEFTRVAKKIYRFDDPGYLSEDKGYIINSMGDGSRVVVIRPKVAENWAFFIRKLNSIEDVSINNLLTDEGAQLPIQFMKWLMESNLIIAVTGKQFSGKSTLIKALVEFIDTRLNIRVQEMIFELYLKKLIRYKHKNILTLRDTESVTAQDITDLFKKSDGDVFIFGEIASAAAASLAVQNALTGSKKLIFSHHAKTTEYLIESFKLSLQQTRVFNNEIASEELVIRAVNYDIHMSTTLDGHIYLERITEIIPEEEGEYPAVLKEAFREFFRRMTNRKRYSIRDIIVCKEGKYHVENTPSQNTRKSFKESLTEEEMIAYDKMFQERKEKIA